MSLSRKPTAIRDADEQIDEVTQRLAAIDRALEALQRRGRRCSTLPPTAQKELQEQIDAVREHRDRLRMELLEIVELAEMPPEFMGWA
jgi:type II secretory pathway pseudopilin PulG